MTRSPFNVTRSAAVLAFVGIAGCTKQTPTTAPAPVPSTAPAVGRLRLPARPRRASRWCADWHPGWPAAGGAQGGAAPGEPNPRPYTSVITPRARTRKGLFSTHISGSRLYFEIPAKELGKDMMLVASLKGTPAGIGIRGTLGNNALLRFERKENRILVRAVNYRNVSQRFDQPHQSRDVDHSVLPRDRRVQRRSVRR